MPTNLPEPRSLTTNESTELMTLLGLIRSNVLAGDRRPWSSGEMADLVQGCTTGVAPEVFITDQYHNYYLMRHRTSKVDGGKTPVHGQDGISRADSFRQECQSAKKSWPFARRTRESPLRPSMKSSASSASANGTTWENPNRTPTAIRCHFRLLSWLTLTGSTSAGARSGNGVAPRTASPKG